MTISDFGQVVELWISMPLRLIVPQVKMERHLPELAGKADINSPNTYIDFPSNLSPVDLVWANQPIKQHRQSPE